MNRRRPVPHPNTYWVRPGRLLAGEYPGAEDARAAREKLRLFLDAGVSVFIDLTEEREAGLVPYEPFLRELAAERGLEVEYERLSIRDVDVPAQPERMVAILDAIDRALSGGRVVYVHCWGGTGRTGTVVGCHLVRRGMRGDTALRRVMELWSTMAKARFRWRSPETDEQRRYVLEWKEQPAPEPPEVPAGS